MSDNTALGDRMKTYEAAHRAVLPRRTYTLLRLDGRSFHTYLRGCQKPFDEQFITDMDAVAEALCAEISGSVTTKPGDWLAETIPELPSLRAA